MGDKKNLICKKCNNTAGYSFKKSMIERVEWEAYKRKVPDIEISAKAVIENIPGWPQAGISLNEQGEHLLRPLHPKENWVTNAATQEERQMTISSRRTIKKS